MPHTPGKWKAELRDDGVTAAILEKLDKKDWGVAIWVPQPPFALGSVGAVVCTAGRPLEEAMANARVMAAGSELLEACKLMAVLHPHNVTLKAAIEKAEGKLPSAEFTSPVAGRTSHKGKTHETIRVQGNKVYRRFS